jgi:methionyl-tRNA formyltransferase
VRHVGEHAAPLFVACAQPLGHGIERTGERAYLARPPLELVRVVRALSPHIGARAELHGREVTVWRARVGHDGSFEPVEVQPASGRRMAYEAWLRGLR